jgi:hypothetical protein
MTGDENVSTASPGCIRPIMLAAVTRAHVINAGGGHPRNV